MKHLLLDSNVVIDFLSDRKPFSLQAARLFDYISKGKVKIYLTAVSYNNIYYLVRKLTNHKEAIRLLKEIENITETIDTTSAVIRNALDSPFKDFEDAIQYFTALTHKKMDAIITRNGIDFKNSTLAILSPEEALGIIESSSEDGS